MTTIYTIARTILMLFGWLTALGLALAADYMLPGAKWPIFIALGSWWTLTYIIYIRQEAEAALSEREAELSR